MTDGPKHSPGSALLDQLVPLWRDTLPATVSRAYFDGFVARHRDQLVDRLDALARRRDATPLAPPHRDEPPALYQELLAQAVDLDRIAARLPAQLGDRHDLAREILRDMTSKGLLDQTTPTTPEGDHHERSQD